ncbi:MAG: CDP-diacylglycerol--glycerol-3-phosphate 3-phosphatidyltransferase [Actinomycetes bacterium]
MEQLNLPNALTVLRILLVPVLVVALLQGTKHGDLLAAGVFCLASFTDLLDGRIARSRGSITTFGQLMDPVADKLLVLAALISLVSLGRVAAWVAMVIIAREFAVTALRAGAGAQGVVVPAQQWGKWKTALQVAMVVALILVGSGELWVDLLVYLTVTVTLISGVDVFFGVRRTVEEARRKREERIAAKAGDEPAPKA